MITGPRRLRGEAGQVGGMEVLPFGLLVFVSATLLFANVWAVIDAKFAVASAAREAARAFAEADSADEATAAAWRRAHETLTAYGRDGSRARVSDPVLDRPFGRCARVQVSVSYEVPAVAVPFLGGIGATSVSSTHSTVVDPFRSGLDGEASC